MTQNQNALRHIYAVFSVYPLQERIECCPHCDLRDVEAALHRKPLRNLGWEDLGIFSFKAITTFGDVEDFKHFLPRLLELHIYDPDGEPYGIFILFSKLDAASWQTWAREETDAVFSTLQHWRAEWKELYTSDDERWRLEELDEELNRANIAV